MRRTAHLAQNASANGRKGSDEVLFKAPRMSPQEFAAACDAYKWRYGLLLRRALYKRRAEQGICTKCGVVPACEQSVYCTRCRDKWNASQKRGREKKAALKLACASDNLDITARPKRLKPA